MGTTYAARSLAARKVANHEIKALAAICDAGIVGLRFPLLSSITYCGYTLLCMSRLPINDSSLVYGSNDGGVTVHASDPRALELACQLGKKLNLKPHSPARFSNLTFYTPIDFEIHRGFDGEYYCCDLSRLFPPTPLPGKALAAPGSHLFQLFRPEFLLTYSKPINSDTYSQFINNAEQLISVREVREAGEELLVRIKDFAEELDNSPTPQGMDAGKEG